MKLSSSRKLAFKLVGAAIVIGLIYWTIGGQWQQIVDHTRTADTSFLVLSFLLYGIALYITALRWQFLLRAQNVNLPHLEVLKLHYSGYFFNTTTPGAVTGDILKIAAIMDKTDNKIIGAMSIFIDRLIGLSGLLVIVLLSLIPATDFIINNEHEEIRLSIIVVSSGAVVGLLCIFLWCIKARLLKLKIIKKITNYVNQNFPKLAHAFNEIFKAGDLYQSKWKTCLALLVVSMVSHVLLGLSFYYIGRALGLEISPVLFILSMQISNAIAAIFPLPGGIGLRDSIGKSFLIAAGTPEIMAATAPLLYSGVILSWSLIGASIFIYSHFTKK